MKGKIGKYFTKEILPIYSDQFSFLKKIWETYKIIFVALIFAVITIKLLDFAHFHSVLLKFTFIAVTILFLVVLIRLRKHKIINPMVISTFQRKYFIVLNVIILYFCLAWVSINIFSFISYEFYLVNMSLYSYPGTELTLASFVNYYSYETLDMVPILDILKTLNLLKVVTPNYGLGAWLLLIFKSFFIFMVIDSFTNWKKQFTLIKIINQKDRENQHISSRRE